MRGEGGVVGSQPVSTAVHRSPNTVNFGDLTPYLTYDENNAMTAAFRYYDDCKN
jgi:hypothetical protein